MGGWGEGQRPSEGTGGWGEGQRPSEEGKLERTPRRARAGAPVISFTALASRGSWGRRRMTGAGAPPLSPSLRSLREGAGDDVEGQEQARPRYLLHCARSARAGGVRGVSPRQPRRTSLPPQKSSLARAPPSHPVRLQPLIHARRRQSPASFSRRTPSWPSTKFQGGLSSAASCRQSPRAW
jgi:hypothetical protein